MDISLVIPLYNEEASLNELIEEVSKVMVKHNYQWEAVLIDDGSNDNSWEVVLQLKEKYQQVKGIRFSRNYGKSAALNVGFEKCSGNVVITMDADLQDNPEEIPALYEMITKENFDLVSGWKKKRYDPASKTIPTKLYNWTTRCVTGIKLHDFNCGLKAYKRKVIKSIEVYGEMHRYIPVIAKRAGFVKIGEKVVQHRKRKYGKTKFGFERFFNGFLDLISILFFTKFGRKPMHFFGLIGTLMFFAGLIIAGYLAYAKFFWAEYRMTERPLFYFGLLAMIIGTQLFMTGFLGELISRNAPDRNKYLVDKTTEENWLE